MTPFFETSAFTSTETGLVFSFTGSKLTDGVVGFAVQVTLNPSTVVLAFKSKFFNSAPLVVTADVVASVTFMVL